MNSSANKVNGSVTQQRTEEALRRSEAYLAEAQRLSHTGSWACDSTTQPLFWSDELYRIFGLDPRQGIPTRARALERIHPEDRDKFLQAFSQAILQKADAEVDYRILLPDGTINYVHGIGRPVFDANGELVEIVGTTVDITERKRADDALRRSEAYLAEAQRLSHTGSWADDGTMQPLYFSDEMYRIYEFDPGQGIPGANQCLERVHPEDRERFLHGFDKLIRLKQDAEEDFRIVMPDGRIKYLHGIGHPVLDAKGDLVELVGTTVDVTERTLAEQALALRSFALNNARDAVALIDERGRLIYVNDQSCRQSGYTQEELLGMFAWDIDRDLTVEEWPSRWQDLKAHRSLTFESHHRKKDGTIFPVELSVSYLEYRGTVFNLAIVRDISERKRAEEALRRSEAYLAEAQRLTHTGSWANDCSLRPVYWS
jgi:PAS domain S-box-containing protein